MWRADYVNDPANDYEIIIEIFCEEREIGKVYNNQEGQVVLVIYADGINTPIPCDWLVKLLSDFSQK